MDKLFKKAAILLCTILLSSCSVLDSILDSESLVEGIERYHIAISSVSLAQSLTFTSSYKKEELLPFKYPYEDAYFRYYFHLNFKIPLDHEDILLSITYCPENYETVLNEIKTYPGFESDINWEYGDYICYLNTQEDYGATDKSRMTNIDIESSPKKIKWINFVAISEKNYSICFVGLYHDDPTVFVEKPYEFNEWSEFFNEWFPFYDWGA